MSCLNCCKMRDQHDLRLFVQHLFFDVEHLIFGMMNAVNSIISFLRNIYLIKIEQFLVKKLYALHREHYDNLSWIGSQFIFSKSFKQNPMHLFWIACKRVIMDFYNDFKNKRQIHVKNAIFSKTVIKLFTIFK